jgi:predicted acyl esterase
MGGVSGPGRVAPPGATGEAASIATRDRIAAAVDGPDGAAQLAAAVASHKDNIESLGVVPFKDSVSTPTGLTWWEKSSPHTYLSDLKKTDIGVLSVANWDEAGTRHGPFFTFNNLPRENTKLLVGPATHCA